MIDDAEADARVRKTDRAPLQTGSVSVSVKTPQAASRFSIWTARTVAATLGVMAVTALSLYTMGRGLWCSGGGLSPWSWDIWTQHNSQHLLDPYSFTHMQHGVLAYALLWWVLRTRWPEARFVTAILIEAGWEVTENTNFVIDSYRESTIALNYYGDSVLNSVADIVAFSLGYTAAAGLSAWASAVAFLEVEAVLLLAIRDSLSLNIVMLLHPIEAIKTWQAGG